jgi:hypothetical protein
VEPSPDWVMNGFTGHQNYSGIFYSASRSCSSFPPGRDTLRPNSRARVRRVQAEQIRSRR